MKRILVVEDQELNRELLVQLLKDEYQIEMAEDGQEALDKVATFRPGKALLDMVNGNEPSPDDQPETEEEPKPNFL